MLVIYILILNNLMFYFEYIYLELLKYKYKWFMVVIESFIYFNIIPEKYFNYAKKIYFNIGEEKILWKNDNKGKSGIYCLLNLKTKKIYVGKSNNLKKRISTYTSLWQYRNGSKSLIIKSIAKYGLKNFALIILEYTDRSDLIYLREREQYWINLLRPEYNIILKVDPYATFALKSKGHKHTELVKAKLREIARKRTKLHKAGISLIIEDIISGDKKKYRSIREAARDLKCDTKSLRVRTLTENKSNLRLGNRKNIHILRNKLFRKRYIVRMDNND